MTKARDANDKTARDQKGRPQQSGEKSRPDILEGTSLQVNENSVEEGDSVHAPASPSRSKEPRREEKTEGKAFQVNKHSVKN